MRGEGGGGGGRGLTGWWRGSAKETPGWVDDFLVAAGFVIAMSSVSMGSDESVARMMVLSCSGAVAE